jgi:hypothetical protein
MANDSQNIYSYTTLILKKGVSFTSPRVAAHIPTPVENDYKAGYIERVFIQRVNDKNSSIIEIHKNNLNIIQSSGYYNFCIINWKIKGTEEEIKSANKKSIKTVFEQMPRLSLYLPNLLQFAKTN